jgi:hypothetical protein
MLKELEKIIVAMLASSYGCYFCLELPFLGQNALSLVIP